MHVVARLNPEETLGDRVIKVNHAGEHGAVSIYTAQSNVSRWRAPRMVQELRELRHHEEHHRALFASELCRRGVRRCRSYALCGAGGYTLGLVTALLGPTAIAATTVAVERVVLRHLEAQLHTLRDSDPAACRAIQAIMSDERQHHDDAVRMVARAGRVWPTIITPIVRAATELVIWLGMRL